VPLSARALEILDEVRPLRDLGAGLIFPGARAGLPLSNMAMLKVLERMGRGDVTVHGFRATFKTWAEETTNFANNVIEAALAHSIGDKVEATYFRGEFLDKRAALMRAWCEFCVTKRPAAVIDLRAAG
jgi:integrase